MIYNTDHLGYKLYSGQLRDRRKHSEQLNKFVAGFFDSDGSVTVFQDKRYNRQLRFKSCITQSHSNDPNGNLLRNLRDFYDIGTVRHRVDDYNQNGVYVWEMYYKDSRKLFNIIGKHLFIKKIHFQSMLDFFENKQVENLDKLRKESRKVSASLTHKKHISPAYLAGLIAGDGYLKCIIGKERYRKKEQRYFISNTLKLLIELHTDDKPILDKILSDFGGGLSKRGNKDTWIYQRSLGVGRSDSIKLIKKLMQYMCLDKKYQTLQEMLEYHQQVAENKHRESDKDK